jgi:hypothetical protein
MQYESLESMVEPYLSKPFDSLPATVAARVLTIFEQCPWDDCGEQRRQQIVKEHDYTNDPAMKPERAHFWNLFALIGDKENEIRNWELMPVPLPTERLVKEQRLSALRHELAALEVQSKASYTEPTVADTATTAPQAETKEQRQNRRLLACETAGLVMPQSSVGRLPNGVGDVADAEGVSRQTFSADIKAALARKNEAIRLGTIVHRA